MGKKKTKTSSTETSRTVTTPTRPDWVDAQARGLNEALTAWGRRDPTASVAPVSDLERRASEGASGLGTGPGWGGGGTDWASWGRPAAGSGPGLPPAAAPSPGSYPGWSARPEAGLVGAPAREAAPRPAPPAFAGPARPELAPWDPGTLAGAGPSPRAASVLDNLSAYMTPFRDQVLTAALEDYDVEAGRRRAAQDLELAGQGAFGGSGAALTRSLTEGELARGRNSRLAGLLDQMFSQGASLATGDADRRQQASVASAEMAQAREQEAARLSQTRDLERARLLQTHDLETARLSQSRDLELARLNQARDQEAAQLSQSRELELARLAQARDQDAAHLSQNRDLESARLTQAAEAARMQDALARAQLGQEGDLARSRLGLDEAASRRADAETQARIGAQLRAAEQARLSAEEAALARRIEMFSGLPLGLFQGSTTDSQGQRNGTETTSGASLGEIASLVNSLTGSPLSRLFPTGGR